MRSTRSRPAGGRPSRPTRASSSRRSLVVVGGVVAVVLIALIAAVLAGSGDDGGSTDTARPDASGPASGSVADDSPVTVTGTPLTRLPDGGDDPALGATMPTLAGTSLDGSALTIPTAGRPTMLMFVAHWCPHCQREVPVVQDWVDAGSLPSGVDLVAVSTAVDPRRPNYPPAEWLDREGWTAPTLVDGNDAAASAAGLSAYPFFVAVDADGTVVGRTSGELGTSQLSSIAEGLSGGGS